MIFRPVEIKEAKEKPDPSDQHESVRMEDHDDNGGDEGDHEEDLRHVEGPGLVGDVVQDDVRKGSGARHKLVGEGEAAGVCHPAHAEEQEAHQGLERLPGDLLAGGELRVHVILDLSCKTEMSLTLNSDHDMSPQTRNLHQDNGDHGSNAVNHEAVTLSWSLHRV